MKWRKLHVQDNDGLKVVEITEHILSMVLLNEFRLIYQTEFDKTVHT